MNKIFSFIIAPAGVFSKWERLLWLFIRSEGEVLNLGTYYHSNEVFFVLEYSRVTAKLLQGAAEQRQAVLKLRKKGKRNRSGEKSQDG